MKINIIVKPKLNTFMILLNSLVSIHYCLGKISYKTNNIYTISFIVWIFYTILKNGFKKSNKNLLYIKNYIEMTKLIHKNIFEKVIKIRISIKSYSIPSIIELF